MPVICWKMKNTQTTNSARRTPAVHLVRRCARRSSSSSCRAVYSTSCSETSVPKLPSAAWTPSYLPCRISHRGDSGILVRRASPISAGTAPMPRMSRQSVVPALPGAALRMMSAIT